MSTNPPGSDLSLSIWIDTSPATEYPALKRDLDVDVAVVGAGITGITAAWLLAKAGLKVALLEKGRIAMSETGHTTAHIVEATDADYKKLVHDHGEEGARLNTDAIRSSINQIRDLVLDLKIDCGFKAVDGYLYAEEEKDREYLERQRDYLQRAGVGTDFVTSVPLPFPTIGGLRFRNQYTFHIRHYLLAVAKAAEGRGARIFENTMVSDVEPADASGNTTVKTAGGTVRSKNVLLATHVPINDRSMIWMKMHQTRTYVVAAPIEKGRVTDALYWDTPYPYHYTRLLETAKGLFLIVGGEDRDVGKEGNDEGRYRALEEYCRDRFRVSSFSHRWSGQINEPADMIPFIGESSLGKNIWMATAYSGTGMTYGTLGGMVMSDLALGRENRFARLYDPTRKSLKSVAENIVTKATEFPRNLIEKVVHADIDAKSLDEVGEGEGKVVKLGDQKVAAARVKGKLYTVAATCTHMGCTVSWNSAENSWDCPCHGSRFDLRGQVLNGPATSPLTQKN